VQNDVILPCASRTYYTYPWIINLYFGYALQTLLSRTKIGDKVSLYSNFMGQSPSLSLHLKYKMMEVVETIWRSPNNLIGTIYIYIWWKLQTKTKIQQLVCKFMIKGHFNKCDYKNYSCKSTPYIPSYLMKTFIYTIYIYHECTILFISQYHNGWKGSNTPLD